ncbi:MAG: hypothetical protein M5U27_15165 [Gaiella sp.]|nr:hypothetical protein [Gaiella sp.]
MLVASSVMLAPLEGLTRIPLTNAPNPFLATKSSRNWGFETNVRWKQPLIATASATPSTTVTGHVRMSETSLSGETCP